jgi:Transglutaminase-like superfamily
MLARRARRRYRGGAVALFEEGKQGDDVDAPAAARVGVGAGLRVRRISTKTQQEHVAFLRRMVDDWKKNQLIRDKAIDIVFRQGGCAPKDKRAHALEIGKWTQRSITYVNDGGEQFQTPTRTLTYRFGDCDDFTTLIASLCESIGVRCQLCAIEWKGQFRHIFPRAIVETPRGLQPMPLDATLRTPVERLTDPVAIATRRGDNPRVFAL